MSTIDRLREQLAIPSPVRPLEPNYPAPISPGPRIFVPPDSLGYGEREPPRIPAPVLSHLHALSGESGAYQSHFIPPSLPPDIPAPILHRHALRSASPQKGYGKPAMDGLDMYGEIHAWEASPEGHEFGDEFRASALDMEQQLEMVAMSLRGDQDEADGVRKGLMMLQPFESDSNRGEERNLEVHLRQGSRDHGISPQMLPRPFSSDSLSSPPDTPRIPACPPDYLRQIAAVESSVLKSDQVSSSWTAARGITATCIVAWTARTNEELSISIGDTLDMSFIDASCMSQDWWFAILADKQHQSGSRLWRFPQDLGLLRKQSGYFPSKCVRLTGSPAPGNPQIVVNSPKSEFKSSARHSTMTQPQASAAPAMQFSFPILQRDPSIDPPLVPFVNVPLWLPTWNKSSPKVGDGALRDTNRVTSQEHFQKDAKPEPEDFDSLPLITSTSDQSEETTFSFTPVPSLHNFAGNVINDSDIDSPAVSCPVSARSATSPRSGLPKLPLFQSSNAASNGTLESHALQDWGLGNLEQAKTDETREMQVLPQTLQDEHSSQVEYRTVQIMRNPNVLPTMPAGIGLQFARPRGEMGACHILAISTEVFLHILSMRDY